jgi:hypothetical protein
MVRTPIREAQQPSQHGWLMVGLWGMADCNIDGVVLSVEEHRQAEGAGTRACLLSLTGKDDDGGE